jgi:ferric-dicitrate binding protein FerR (iron transport regulator)
VSDNKEHLILSYLQGELSPEARQEFESWRSESEENRRMVDQFQHIWQLTGNKKIDFQSQEEWRKLASSLHAAPEASVRKLNVQGKDWLKIAAAVLVVLLSSGIVYLTIFRVHEVSIQTADNNLHAVLPDGSEVWLNRDSRLTYDNNFDEDRFVNLEGEGFFDIKSDPARPFIIRTVDAQIKVAGTSFNVKAYARDIQTEVLVVTGKVSLGTIDQSRSVILTPGVKGILTRNDHRLITERQENDNSLAWKNKLLVFKKTPLRKVVKVLRSYFRKDIQVTNEKLLPCRFTGSFSDPTLDEVVETLGIALDLEVNVTKGTYMLDGAGCEEN